MCVFFIYSNKSHFVVEISWENRGKEKKRTGLMVESLFFYPFLPPKETFYYLSHITKSIRDN